MNYEEDIRIDESALDVEWLEQGPLAIRYGRHAVHMAAEVRRLEEVKKTIRSELVLEANKNPSKCLGKDKPNAADIEAYYRDHQRYKDVIEELLEAQEEAEYAEVAKNEICFTRKKALEMLVELHGQQYFAGPTMPRDLTEERALRQRQKRSDAGVAAKMRRQTR